MDDTRFAPLPEPPYYAVIFTNQLADPAPGYEAMADKIAALASQQPGYLGVESTRDSSGLGVTVSYWRDQGAVQNWKQVAEHLGAQELGKTRWYKHYTLRVARVERAYSGPDGR